MAKLVKNGLLGWRIDEHFSLPKIGKALKLSTFKGSDGKLNTSVEVGVITDGVFKCKMFDDYCNRILVTSPGCVTAKAVEKQHKKVKTDMMFTVLAEIGSFYADEK